MIKLKYTQHKFLAETNKTLIKIKPDWDKSLT